MIRDLHLLIDSREQRPLPFPSHLVVLNRDHSPTFGTTTTLRVHTARKDLPTGDYALSTHPHLTVERKGSLSELAANCLTSDRTRFLACLTRLSSPPLTRSLLVLEGNPSSRMHGPHPPSAAMDAFLDLMARHPRIDLLIHPTTTQLQRRTVGEWVLRWLLSHSLVRPTTMDLDREAGALSFPTGGPAG